MGGIPDAICWHEGMHLLPQHFQLQALRAETLATRLAAATHPWFWGVEHLELDESALSCGLVRITALDAMMPDGLPVSLDASNELPLELDAKEQIEVAPQGWVTIFLAIAPLYRAGQLAPLEGRLLSKQSEPLPDLASGLFPEPLSIWRADLRLVTESHKADSVCLPLLRLGKLGGGYSRIPYLPPSPILRADSALGHKVAALCARTREKCLFLAGRLRQAQAAGNSEDAVEIRRLLAALWMRLPEVEAALGSRVAHPEAVHRLLCGMAGALVALDPLAGVPTFKPLAYDELLAGYDELLNWLNAALELVRAGYRCVPFARDTQGFWIDLPEQADGWPNLTIGLRMPTGTSEVAATQWLAGAIIASEPHIATLLRQRMRGMSQQPLNRQEQISYNVSEDTRLFVLRGEREWFDPHLRLRIALPGAGSGPEPWEVLLFIDDTNDKRED